MSFMTSASIIIIGSMVPFCNQQISSLFIIEATLFCCWRAFVNVMIETVPMALFVLVTILRYSNKGLDLYEIFAICCVNIAVR